MNATHDAIIIGSGQAGPFLAVRLAQAGQKVALVEREHFGGTCVNDGCIPTKTLVASARAAHIARRAADYGVKMGAGRSGHEGRENAQGSRRCAVDRESHQVARLDGGPEDVFGHARFRRAHACGGWAQLRRR